MADGIIQVLPDSTGKKVDTSELTVGANTVERQRIVLADDATAAAVAGVNAKGTQGGYALAVQRLHDAGRSTIQLYTTNVTAGTTATEAAVTLTKAAGTAATSSASSFVITSGKTFRITSIVLGLRGHSTATTAIITLSLRVNTGGAVTTTTTPVLLALRAAVPATALAWDRVYFSLPDGLEIAGNGTLQFGFTVNPVFVTNAPTYDVLVTGFEY